MGVSTSYRESRLAAKVETLEKEKDDLVGNFTNIIRCLRAEVDKLKQEKAEMKTKLKELTTVNSNLRQQILEEKSMSGRKAPPEPIDDGELLSLGLSLVGFGPSRQKVRNELKLRRWRAHYGIAPKAVFKLMEDMKKYQAQPFNLLHLLMSIGWLKMYETEELLSGRWGLSEQTCRETVRDYQARIQSLKPRKISFSGLSRNCEFCPVDTVHIRCFEFRCDPSNKWYSIKFHGPGVAFEVVCDPVSGRILWINGPKPPSIDDCVFLRGGSKDAPKATWDRSALYFHVPSWVKLVGDSAYDSQPDKVTPTLGSHAPETKKLFARMKSMQETFFKRCKDFNVLTNGFRHGTCTEDKLAKIKLAFESVAVLLAYDFENGHPLFEV